MPGQDRAGEASSVKRYLSQYVAGTVLVVGAREHNFPQDLRSHDRVVIWDSTQLPANKPIPASTRVIVCLRFISHALFAHLQRYAKKNHCLLMPGLNNAGEVKQMLTLALDLAPTEPPQTPSLDVPPVERLRRSLAGAGLTTRQFVRTYGDRSHLPMIAEARRLHALTPQYGIKATVAALTQQIGFWHRSTPLPETPAVETPEKAELLTPMPMAVQTPPPAPLPVTDDRRLASALRLIDDVAAGLSLLREELQRLSDDDTDAHATITALRQLLNVPSTKRS